MGIFIFVFCTGYIPIIVPSSSHTTSHIFIPIPSRCLSANLTAAAAVGNDTGMLAGLPIY